MPALPLTLAAGLVCLAASVFDLRQRRIPNAFPAALLGISLACIFLDEISLGSAAGALLLCCAVTLPIYIARGLGAGDVKFVAAAGAVLGLESVPDMLLGFALLAGVLGLGAIFLHPGRSMLLERWLALRDLPRRGIAAYRPPGSGDPGRIRLPMAPAISTAFLWALCGGTFF